jgi:hypothetical protein
MLPGMPLDLRLHRRRTAQWLPLRHQPATEGDRDGPRTLREFAEDDAAYLGPGWGYYNLALESAREVGDNLQGAAALAHMAFIPAADYGFGAALDYLRAARDHVAKRPDNRVASWVSAVESEIQTNAGSHTAALGRSTGPGIRSAR